MGQGVGREKATQNGIPLNKSILGGAPNPPCLVCEGPIEARNRNGKKKEFCGRPCKQAFTRESQRVGGEILRKQKRQAERPKGKPRVTLNKLIKAKPEIETALIAGLAMSGIDLEEAFENAGKTK